jgi:hypothetical protein
MKINTRTLVLAMALGTTAVANAQFRFFFAYGDAQTVGFAQNAFLGGQDPTAAIGKEIPSGTNFKVPKAADTVNTFTVQLWVEKIGGNADTLYAGASNMVAFDTATAGNAGAVPIANFVDKKIVPSNATANSNVSNRASFGAFDNTGADLSESAVLGANSQFRGSWSSSTTATMRPVGIGIQSTFLDSNGSPAFFKLGVGSKTRLMNLTLRSALNPNEIYGDNGTEAGLQYFVGGTATQAAGAMSYIGSQIAGNTGTRLTLQAVPEPTTALAIAAGLAAMVLRRRSK